MAWFNFHFQDFAFSFLSVLFEGVPFLLLGSLISGLVEVFVSPERLNKFVPKNRVVAVLFGGALGLILPICECGSVVVIRRFLKKGLPLGCAVAYMLGAPIVSPLVAISTWAAFSADPVGPLVITALRMGMGYAIAVGVALIIDAQRPEAVLQPGILAETRPARGRTGLSTAPQEGPDPATLAAANTVMGKLRRVVQSATADFLDVTFYFVIGVAVTSVFNTAVRADVLDPIAQEPLLAIGGLMVLASLLALCSTTDAFIAWTFVKFPTAAKIAFMVFGPMFDFKLFFLYGLVFQRRVVVLLAIGLFLTVGLLSWRLAPVFF